MSEPLRYAFDTEFAADGAVAAQAPRPKRAFTPDEVEQIRKQAYAEGEAAGLASIAAEQALALAVIANACGQALPKLAEVAHEHREASARLALACGRAIADAALEKFPEAPVQAALVALAREIESAPRLVVTVAPEMAEKLQGVLNETALSVGFAGAVQVKSDTARSPRAFTLDFGDGAAAFDPQAAAARVSEALEAALAAEGLHAEPLIPGSEG